MNYKPSDVISLTRDVEAHIVPSGDKIKLLAGNPVRITQALGGNYTIMVNGNLMQISAENIDALGLKKKKNKNVTSEQFSENLI